MGETAGAGLGEDATVLMGSGEGTEGSRWGSITLPLRGLWQHQVG